jgi:hypothetical protein
MPAGGGVFNPPPPACTTCPLINWNNTVGTGNNNGTPCDISDDYIPVTITVNHQNCAKSTGSGQFTVVNTSTSTTIGSYVFNETSPTIITYNAPVGTSNSTQFNVSTTFPCNVQQALTGIPNGTFLGFPFVDTTAPVITCPADINISNNAGQCGAFVNFSVTATDNCQVTLSYSHNPGSFFPIGTTTVTVTAMDASENSSTCTFTVTVVDNELPVITCQPDVVVNIDPNTCGATVSFVNGTGNIYTSGAFDMQLRTLDGTTYSEINNITINPSSGSYSRTTGMAKDPVNGDVYVVLNNFTNNRALAKLDLVTGNATIVGNTGRYFASIAFTSTGNLYGVTGNGSGYGAQNSLYSINKSNATSTYLTALNGTANHALAFNTDDGKLYHWSAYLMEKIDLGSNAITNITLSGNPDYSNPGAATYTGNGNFMLLTYYGYYINSVTANGVGVNLGSNNYSKGVFKDGTGSGISASDNCTYTLTQTAGLPSGSVFPVGTTTNTFVATDASGNTATCSFNVTVVDNQLPTITCPADILVYATSAAGATVTYVAPVGTDNCPVSPVLTAGLPSGSTFPIGTTTVTHKVTDPSGNTAECSFTVTVTGLAPQIVCPANITVNNDEGQCGAIVNFAATETVAIPASTITYSQNPGTFFPKGTTTVTATAVNAVGTSICTFTVTVNDTENPTITCNTPIEVSNDEGQCGAVVTYTVTSTDNCAGQTIAQTAGLPSGSFFPKGTTTNTFVVTDASGNTATCSFTVTVNDTENPTITCNAPIVVSNDEGQCGAVVTYSVTSSDNCPGQTVLQTAGLPSGSLFPKGTTTNTFIVTDASGNTATCSFTVTVNDTEAPGITCPADVTVNCQDDNSSASTGTGTASDNCTDVESIIITQTQTSTQTATGAGHYNYVISRTWRATDESGNFSECTQTITVHDVTAPVITCTANVTINCQDNNTSSATGVATATDNCSAAAITQTQTSTQNANPANAGYYNYVISRTWRATDESGNFSTCVQTITVRDITAPVALCKPVTITLVNGTATVTASSVNNGSSDNCSPVTLSVSKTSFNCSNIGNNTVTLTVTDVSGNSSTCTAVVTVVGEIPSCSITAIPGNNIYTGGVATNLYLGYGPQTLTLQVNAPASGAPYTYAWSGGILSNYNTANPVFTAATPGLFTYTVLVTNKYGCVTTCSVSICVKDIRVPGSTANNMKVYVCHNGNTISISTNGVASHIPGHPGDRLGSCSELPCAASNSLVTSKGTEENVTVVVTPQVELLQADFGVNVYPNPSAYDFGIQVMSKSSEPVTIRILDLNGKVRSVQTQISKTNSIKVGNNLAGGTYFAEVTQGSNKQVVKLVKLN